eukprot:CAMPEP_0182858134 /NCGR_PEP_ID=MMETSP0034_2-20130328/3480_1 /TAXON_ID=156128 /ORGANISM="Nephroselmis pyriformis, Strain CCMP717" /LENGTH=488 /DNA_ID=CAMNT_0024989487 /DNA_START=23 /DNA_END=1485 /DNA_ORIENTATION=+
MNSPPLPYPCPPFGRTSVRREGFVGEPPPKAVRSARAMPHLRLLDRRRPSSAAPCSSSLYPPLHGGGNPLAPLRDDAVVRNLLLLLGASSPPMPPPSAPADGCLASSPASSSAGLASAPREVLHHAAPPHLCLAPQAPRPHSVGALPHRPIWLDVLLGDLRPAEGARVPGIHLPHRTPAADAPVSARAQLHGVVHHHCADMAGEVGGLPLQHLGARRLRPPAVRDVPPVERQLVPFGGERLGVDVVPAKKPVVAVVLVVHARAARLRDVVPNFPLARHARHTHGLAGACVDRHPGIELLDGGGGDVGAVENVLLVRHQPHLHTPPGQHRPAPLARQLQDRCRRVVARRVVVAPACPPHLDVERDPTLFVGEHPELGLELKLPTQPILRALNGELQLGQQPGPEGQRRHEERRRKARSPPRAGWRPALASHAAAGAGKDVVPLGLPSRMPLPQVTPGSSADSPAHVVAGGASRTLLGRRRAVAAGQAGT